MGDNTSPWPACIELDVPAPLRQLDLTRFPIFTDLLAPGHHTGKAKHFRYVVDHGLQYIAA